MAVRDEGCDAPKETWDGPKILQLLSVVSPTLESGTRRTWRVSHCWLSEMGTEQYDSQVDVWRHDALAEAPERFRSPRFASFRAQTSRAPAFHGSRRYPRRSMYSPTIHPCPEYGTSTYELAREVSLNL